MFPYRDENETRTAPIVTCALIAANFLAWIGVQGAGSTVALARSVCDLGLIPGELTQLARPGSGFPMGEGLVCLTDRGPEYLNVITSMFLHGSWAHLLGNMWFLWIFGNNVEDSMGRMRFLAFYLLSGIGAAALQTWVNPASVIPMVGASGAISGVMGGYVVLYPFARVYVMLPIGFFLTSVVMPAWTMVGYWALIQFLSGILSAGGPETGGVAFWAHVGGLVIGLVLVKIFARPEYVREHKARHWAPRRVGWRAAG
jgi:membrane associated rhomboid family serine protease